MSYDTSPKELEALNIRLSIISQPCDNPVETRDLEHLSCYLELAVLSLADHSAATFTRDQIFAEARTIAGNAVSMRESDMDIVMKQMKMIKKLPGKLFCQR